MPIDVSRETLIPFGKAPGHIPGRPHVSTLHRWRMRGVRGRKLESVVCGGRRFTSIQAIHRFMQTDDPVEGTEFSDRGLEGRADEVEHELDRLGL